MQDKYLDECLDAIRCLVGHPEGSKVAGRFAACTALQQNLLRSPHDALSITLSLVDQLHLVAQGP